MAEGMADRRDSPRYALTLVAHVSEPGNSTVLVARSSDVSRSGCYIDTLNPLPPGTMTNIQLRSGEEIFETLARVVYVCPGLGMGVKWATDAPDQQQRFAVLDRWLQKAARTSS
jgi:PilZ domain